MYDFRVESSYFDVRLYEPRRGAARTRTKAQPKHGPSTIIPTSGHEIISHHAAA